MREATQYVNDIAEQEQEDSMAAMRAAGTTTFYELSDAERKQWIDALTPVHKEMASRIGQETLDAFNAALGH